MVRNRMPDSGRGRLFRPELLALLALFVSMKSVDAQHPGHGGPQFGVSASAAGIEAETVPADDSVLSSSPTQVLLNFNQPVRLVKLVIYSHQRDWVDIGFRYQPRSLSTYAWPVPALLPADYYSVNWAILEANNRLVKGSFSFSFGSGAETPSIVMARERKQSENGSMPSELRGTGTVPGSIRFSDKPAPRFEPPFAPVLGQPR